MSWRGCIREGGVRERQGSSRQPPRAVSTASWWQALRSEWRTENSQRLFFWWVSRKERVWGEKRKPEKWVKKRTRVKQQRDWGTLWNTGDENDRCRGWGTGVHAVRGKVCCYPVTEKWLELAPRMRDGEKGMQSTEVEGSHCRSGKGT